MKNVDRLLKLASQFEKNMLNEKYGQDAIKQEQQDDSNRFAANALLDDYIKPLVETTLDKAVNLPTAPQDNIDVTFLAKVQLLDGGIKTSFDVQTADPAQKNWATRALAPVARAFDAQAKKVLKEKNVKAPYDSDFKVNRVY